MSKGLNPKDAKAQKLYVKLPFPNFKKEQKLKPSVNRQAQTMLALIGF